MSNIVHQAVTVFLGFFAIMNPIANTAVFIGLTADNNPAERRQTARKALMISFFIILAFSISGKAIFHLFGITLPALRITGGAMVFIIGYQMLHGSASKMHSSEGDSHSDISVSPLAVPILAGPGTIATSMNYSATGGWSGVIITVTSFFLLSFVTFICFMSGEKLMKLIGKSGMEIITRLMGLILAVIGVQMLLEGIKGALTTWGIS